ncbi:MAG: penicillin-binding protein 2 [Alphaproteobacteria bacterium]|nr:penicillin-binding protein 2 [Alphaproteobacteria bacterium]
MFEIGKDIIKGGAVAANVRGRARLRFVQAVFFLLFAIFITRTITLGISGPNNPARAGSAARVQSGTWVSARADIVDRNGDILAKNVISGHIVLRPPRVKNADQAAVFIHNVIPEKSISDALADINSGKRFIYLKKLATDAQRDEVKFAKIPGVSVEETERRRYPKRRLFSHVVGFIGTDMKGLEGAERTHDRYLSENSAPLVLSVDSRIQSVFYQELSAAMQKYQAKAAMGLLMNSRTGEMLAMVSLPDFDPENRETDSPARRKFNPIRGVFELGSVFKVFNTAMAMETGIGLDKEYYVKDPYKITNRNGRVIATIRDVASFKPPRPDLSVAEILAHSSNAGSVQIALDLPATAQQDFFARANMDRALDLEFGRTERPLMPAQWGPVERATVSIGHGIAVTPMHLLLGFNAMVGGGIYIWPTISRRGIGEIQGERVISAKISEELRKIMFEICEDFTCRKARIAGINIGGKTGTAEKRVEGVIDRRKNITVFAGAFPIEAPQYTILVILDEPQGTTESFGIRTAAWNAVPVTGNILDSILPMLF